MGAQIMKNAIWIVVLVAVAGVLITVGVLRKGGTDGSKKIGVIPKETVSVYWEGVRQGALKAGEEEGYEILWNGPEVETDRERQVQIVEDMMAQKVAGIVLAPSDSKALVPVVDKVHERGIPCVIVDSGVDTENILSYMATDNYKGGVLAAQRMGQILEGKGKIIIVRWTPNSGSTDARLAGFSETLAKEYPDIQIVDAQYPSPPTTDKARDVTDDMLTRNPDVDGIFACNATTAGGALTALRNADQGQKKIKMIGFDAWPMVVDGLEKGDLDSLIIQNPFKMGYEGVKAIVRHMQGQTVPKEVDTGVELITQDRLADPKVRELLGSQI
jgi:ribose transport system substrate-binding protein